MYYYLDKSEKYYYGDYSLAESYYKKAYYAAFDADYYFEEADHYNKYETLRAEYRPMIGLENEK